MLTDMRLFFNQRKSVPNLVSFDKVCFGMGHLGGVLSRKPCIFIASSSIEKWVWTKLHFSMFVNPNFPTSYGGSIQDTRVCQDLDQLVIV